MIIEFDSSLYKSIRENFYSWYFDRYGGGLIDQNIFQEEIHKYSGVIENKGQAPMSQYVTDSLGMCLYFNIKFSDEKLYLMFLLRWC